MVLVARLDLAVQWRTHKDLKETSLYPSPYIISCFSFPGNCHILTFPCFLLSFAPSHQSTLYMPPFSVKKKFFLPCSTMETKATQNWSPVKMLAEIGINQSNLVSELTGKKPLFFIILVVTGFPMLQMDSFISLFSDEYIY